MFTVLNEDGQARCGVLKTRHGDIQTPIFMPVGTQATVKGMTPAQIEEVGAQIILGNTYHLNIRPGSDLVHEMGGLHKFMNWKGPILTDSGGFQVFSLSKLRKITEKGIEFRSHLDGRKLFLGPQNCYEIQKKLDTDIAMVLDECPPYPCERDACESAVTRTIRWAGEFLEHATEDGFIERGHHVFGIIQGSIYDDLRQHCGQALAEMDFPGYAIGGVSVGEHKSALVQAIDFAAKRLPPEKPRYLMGVGTPEDFFEAILRGVDMFDCVTPTRHGRMHQAFTSQGRMNLRNQRWQHDTAPMDPDCSCEACRGFSRGYIRHLAKSGEILGGILISIHNVHFFHSLMTEMRQAIFESNLPDLQERYLDVMTRRI